MWKQLSFMALLSVAAVAYAEKEPSIQDLAAKVAMKLPIPVPVAGGVQKDKAAVAELTAFGQLTSPAPSVLTGVAGLMTIGEPTAARTYDATMLVGEHGRFRIDVHSPEEESVRAFGVKAETSKGGSKPKPIHMSLFMSAYVFGVTAQHLLADPTMSLVDYGVLKENGQDLHHIRACKLSLAAAQRPECGDLYLDPSTHLLRYSVAMIPLDEYPFSRVQRVIEYDNYSDEQGTTMAHRFVESDNGQVGTTLEVQSVAFTAAKDDSQFRF